MTLAVKGTPISNWALCFPNFVLHTLTDLRNQLHQLWQTSEVDPINTNGPLKTNPTRTSFISYL